jgi:hypothetical protein
VGASLFHCRRQSLESRTLSTLIMCRTVAHLFDEVEEGVERVLCVVPICAEEATMTRSNSGQRPGLCGSCGSCVLTGMEASSMAFK